MTALQRAAREWWRAHRPRDWDESLHLTYPPGNLTVRADQRLARAVALDLRRERRLRLKGRTRLHSARVARLQPTDEGRAIQDVSASEGQS